MIPAGWSLERQRDRAQRLHDWSASRLADDDLARTVRVLEVTRPAVIMGSSQPESDVDTAAAAAVGVDVARRRSGGGAVLVSTDSVVWVDLILPAGDRLWDDDVRRAPFWVGEAWTAALEAVGAGVGQVWRGAPVASDWSGRVCFAGVAPGEVLIASRKVVGVSQRRNRRGVLFQTAALLQWQPGELLGLLSATEADRALATAQLQGVAAGVGPGLGDALLSALLRALPA